MAFETSPSSMPPIWNIRQFQQIGGPSVTAWREARRFATQDNADDILARIGSEKLKALIAAIDAGDWKGYIEQSGGATAPRKEQPLRAFHVLKESLNKYGEAAKKILGDYVWRNSGASHSHSCLDCST